MEKKDIISSGLLEMYVTGASSAEETAQVERWRDQYPEIKNELLAIEQAMESYAMANAIVPGSSLKSEILRAVHTSGNDSVKAKSQAKVVSISPVWKSIAAAAIILFICSAVINFINYKKYQTATAKYEESERTIALQSERLNGMNRDMGIIQSKYSDPVALNPMPDAPDAAAKIFWMKNTGETYVDPSNLPPAPQGMEYQLWAIVDGKPVDGGMIHSDGNTKYSIIKMKTFGRAEAFAITLETKGGHPEPKGKMYVMGKI